MRHERGRSATGLKGTAQHWALEITVEPPAGRAARRASRLQGQAARRASRPQGSSGVWGLAPTRFAPARQQDRTPHPHFAARGSTGLLLGELLRAAPLGSLGFSHPPEVHLDLHGPVPTCPLAEGTHTSAASGPLVLRPRTRPFFGGMAATSAPPLTFESDSDEPARARARAGARASSRGARPSGIAPQIDSARFMTAEEVRSIAHSALANPPAAPVRRGWFSGAFRGACAPRGPRCSPDVWSVVTFFDWLFFLPYSAAPAAAAAELDAKLSRARAVLRRWMRAERRYPPDGLDEQECAAACLLTDLLRHPRALRSEALARERGARDAAERARVLRSMR